MPRTLYHVYIKAKDVNLFYGSIKAITDQNSHKVLGIGRDTLYRWDWKKKFDNDNITIEKSELLSTNDVKMTPPFGYDCKGEPYEYKTLRPLKKKIVPPDTEATLQAVAKSFVKAARKIKRDAKK